MTTYFDFTPYVTDTFTHVKLANPFFVNFFTEQLDEQHIPYTCEQHEYLIDEGGPVDGLYMDPIYGVDYSYVTTPLNNHMIDIIRNCGNYDNIDYASSLYKAFDQSLADASAEDMKEL